MLSDFAVLREGKIHNEAELRYVVGDNILRMICELGNFMVTFFITLLLSVSLCI